MTALDVGALGGEAKAEQGQLFSEIGPDPGSGEAPAEEGEASMDASFRVDPTGDDGLAPLA
ncbi:MAG TPA: hypothetical protein P5142_12565 [Spirochaetia bacterium]|nr:hypothetical protein [Spirochaetia bacterium]